MKIPLVDLKAQYASIKKEIDVSIQSGIYETAFIKGNSRRDFPNVNKISNKILSLPIYPELTKNNIDYIVNTIRKFYKDYV